jgi:hypothetical protein
MAAGNLGRDAVRGFGAWQTDLSAQRAFQFSAWCRFLFQLQAFNALNRAQFADPSRFLSNPMFGRSNSALNYDG